MDDAKETQNATTASAESIWVTSSPGGGYWIAGSPQTYSVSPSVPVKARWHLVHDVWALADEADGEILARVWEEKGLWVVKVDEDPEARYLSEKQAKTSAEQWADVDEVVVGTRQNSAGIP